MLRSVFTAASRSPRCRTLVEHAPLVRPIVERFVAGRDVDDAVLATRVVATDRLVTLDHLGEEVMEQRQAEEMVSAYRILLRRLGDEGLAERAEVSVKLSALGQSLPVDGEKIALAHAWRICEAATAIGTTVTVDMEDHTTIDGTLSVIRALRADYPSTGAVLQAGLKRTEGDCADLSGPGSRIRLCKGAYDEPASVAYRDKPKVDASYVRCLQILMRGQGYPMVATHDERLIDIARHLAGEAGRSPADYELQMLHGVRPDAQRRLASEGLRMRVYLPYGTDWFPYFMRRLGERPANLMFFLRSLASSG